MAKVKVTSRFKMLEYINKLVDGTTAEAIGATVVETAKEMIAGGQSPVRGWGRFEAYKAQGRVNSIEKDRRAVSRGLTKGSNAHQGVQAAAKLATEKAKQGYPYSVMKKYPDKNVRPVNLELTHEMQEGFGFRRLSDNAVEVGYLYCSAKRKEIAGYHQSGTENMAARRTIPQKGEEWAVRIMRQIRDIYGRRVVAVIREANKK